ncbi:MAG: hypothetical protein H8E38_06575 [SAR324 cluster bacterium]|nr:hypothetical protein [SAR324 cluster bacterium]
MKSLIEDLQTPKHNLNDFFELTKRVLNYLPDVISETREVNGYLILTSSIAGTIKYARPINKQLFIFKNKDFEREFNKFGNILKTIKRKKFQNPIHEYEIIDKIAYTIQQSVGIGLDFLSNPNSARKHVGNRFEELIRLRASLKTHFD